jgi:hypothetical protein
LEENALFAHFRMKTGDCRRNFASQDASAVGETGGTALAVVEFDKIGERVRGACGEGGGESVGKRAGCRRSQ